MSQRTLVVIEVNGGNVVGVYGPNLDFVVVDYDNIERGDKLPTRRDAHRADRHSQLAEDVAEALFGACPA